MGIIRDLLNRDKEPQASRNYLGASSCGDDCARKVWYSYHQPIPITSAQVLRKFDVGHALEGCVYKWLTDDGFEIGGKQHEFKDGDVGGHCDGFVKVNGEWQLLEIKTSNEFYFKLFVKDGIRSNSNYYAQVQIYMHKFKVKKCLFFVVNKNDQDLYEETVEYNEYDAVMYLERAKNITVTKEVPDRHYPKKTFFKCVMCAYRQECWK